MLLYLGGQTPTWENWLAAVEMSRAELDVDWLKRPWHYSDPCIIFHKVASNLFKSGS